MMRHVRLAGPGALLEASQTLQTALQQLQECPGDAQSVYSSLTSMLSVLDAHPQVSALVDATLASEANMTLLRDLMRLHAVREELQWALSRLVCVACGASRRFQCQAGKLKLWKELFRVRSTHSQSLRVLEASLMASEALFRSHEFHVAMLQQEAPQLLRELLELMDRFHGVQTPRRRAHRLVELALRVLAALYASPKPVGLLLLAGQTSQNADSWASAILRRLLDSLPVFLVTTSTVRLWLDMTLFLVRQQPAQATQSLFPSASASTIDAELGGHSIWFVQVLEHWQAQPAVVYPLLAVFTHIFALPHNTLGDYEQLALAQRLLTHCGLLDVVVDVLQHYHRLQLNTLTDDHGDKPNDKKHSGMFQPAGDWADSASCRGQDAETLVLLESLRLVRQWSERSALIPRFETSRCVRASLLPVLVQQLHLCHESASAKAPVQLQFVLEILLILRHWATAVSLLDALRRSENLQTSLKYLRASFRPSRGSTAASSRGSYSTMRSEESLCGQSDSELDALVARETFNLLALLFPARTGATSASSSLSTASRRVQSRDAGARTAKSTARNVLRRPQRVDKVKSSTFRIYTQ